MIEVHPPEHPLNSPREFFLHIFTITIGLFIALSLENAAEWVHHVHQRREADANITNELRDNERNLDTVLKAAPKERDNLIKAIHFLNAHMAGAKSDVDGVTLDLSLGSLRDASWQTANANNALSYMEYAHAKRYAAAYALQTQFNELQKDTLAAFLTVQANVLAGEDPQKASLADSQRAKVEIQQALARVVALDQIGQSLRASYEKALKGE